VKLLHDETEVEQEIIKTVQKEVMHCVNRLESNCVSFECHHVISTICALSHLPGDDFSASETLERHTMIPGTFLHAMTYDPCLAICLSVSVLVSVIKLDTW